MRRIKAMNMNISSNHLNLEEIVANWVETLLQGYREKDKSHQLHHRLVLSLPRYTQAEAIAIRVEAILNKHRNREEVQAMCMTLARRDPRNSQPEIILPVVHAYRDKDEQRALLRYPFAPMVYVTTLPLLGTTLWFAPQAEWDAHERRIVAGLLAHHSSILVIGLDSPLTDYWSAFQNLSLTLNVYARMSHQMPDMLSHVGLITHPFAWAIIQNTDDSLYSLEEHVVTKTEKELQIDFTNPKRATSIALHEVSTGRKVVILAQSQARARALYQELSNRLPGQVLYLSGAMRRYERAQGQEEDESQKYDIVVMTSLLRYVPRNAATWICEQGPLDVLAYRLQNAIEAGADRFLIMSESDDAEPALSFIKQTTEDGRLSTKTLAERFLALPREEQYRLLSVTSIPPVLLPDYVRMWHEGDSEAPDPTIFLLGKPQNEVYIVVRADIDAILYAQEPPPDEEESSVIKSVMEWFYDVCPISPYEYIPVPIGHAKARLEKLLKKHDTYDRIIVLRPHSAPVPIRTRPSLRIYPFSVIFPDQDFSLLPKDIIVIPPDDIILKEMLNEPYLSNDSEPTPLFEDDGAEKTSLTFTFRALFGRDIAELAQYRVRAPRAFFLRLRPDFSGKNKFQDGTLRKRLFETYEEIMKDDELNLWERYEVLARRWHDEIVSWLSDPLNDATPQWKQVWEYFSERITDETVQRRLHKRIREYNDGGGIVVQIQSDTPRIRYRRHITDGPRDAFPAIFYTYNDSHDDKTPVALVRKRAKAAVGVLSQLAKDFPIPCKALKAMQFAARFADIGMVYADLMEVGCRDTLLHYHERFAAHRALATLKRAHLLDDPDLDLSLMLHLLYAQHGAGQPWLGDQLKEVTDACKKALEEKLGAEHLVMAVDAFYESCDHYGWWGQAWLTGIYQLVNAAVTEQQ